MSQRLSVRPFAPGDVSVAAELLALRHRADRAVFSVLPPRFEDAAACEEVVRSTMSFANGFVAEADGRMAGFIFAIQNLQSPTSGSARYGPLRTSMMFAHGHAVAPGLEPFPVYNALFAEVAKRYVAAGIFDHVAHVPASDARVNDAWNSLGFGRGAAVAARTTEPIDDVLSGDVRTATVDDLDFVYRIAASGNAFHALPPIFTAYVEGDAKKEVRESLRKALADESQSLFLGRVDGEDAGLLWVGPPKGSPLFTPDDSCYIGDTAVLPAARHSGLGSAILSSALGWARERDYRHVTLHFATANPVSSAFWQGHGFVPVMFHLRRHLDERIAWAQPPEDLIR